MMYAIILTADGDAFAMKCDNSLEFYQDAVGGFIEVVRLGARRLLVVNDEGLIKGMPFNRTASWLYGEPIHGNAVVVKEDGEDFGLFTKEEIDEMKTIGIREARV